MIKLSSTWMAVCLATTLTLWDNDGTCRVHCWFSRWDVPLEKAPGDHPHLLMRTLWAEKRAEGSSWTRSSPRSKRVCVFLVESSSVCLGRRNGFVLTP